jgi:hypothetical protein
VFRHRRRARGIGQQVENLRLDIDQLAAAAQFAPLEVEHVLAKGVCHFLFPEIGPEPVNSEKTGSP